VRCTASPHAARFQATRALLLGALLGVLVVAGCSGRERDNPFDPLNPGTHGTPPASRAVARCGAVDLTWEDEGMGDIDGFRVWRSDARLADAESLLTPVPLPRSAGAYRDSALVNGERYQYRIEFLFGGAGARTAPVAARPGAALAWCGDPCGWGLQLLSADAGSILHGTDYGMMTYDLDVDEVGHRVFAADLSDLGRVWMTATDGSGDFEEIPIAGATAVRWSGAAGALLVASFYESAATWVTPGGEVLHRVTFTGRPRFYPEAVACRDLACSWIALVDSLGAHGCVVRVNAETQVIDTVAAAFVRPVAVADDERGGGCWVADRAGTIVYVRDDLSLAQAAAGTVAEPTDLSADGAGGCWVADRETGSLVRVNRACGEEARIECRPGIHGVTYDPLAASLWVTIPAREEVLVLSAGAALGDTLGHGSVLGCPVKIAGDWGGGCP
jgi:hypothetical protein